MSLDDEARALSVPGVLDVADADFEAAVTRRILSIAHEGDVEKLEASPALWRSCLGVRRSILHNLKGQAVQQVTVQEGPHVRTFQAKVSALNSFQVAQLHSVIDSHYARAKELMRAMHHNQTIIAERRRPQRELYRSLIGRAIAFVPTDTPEGAAWWAEWQDYCRVFRGERSAPPVEAATE